LRCISPVKSHSIEDLLKLSSSIADGSFPIGANNFWHGGIHLPVKEAIVAAAPGRVIAYRMSQDYLTVKEQKAVYYYSNCFALLEHNYCSRENVQFRFYSLYMHLLPYSKYKTDTVRPSYLTRIPFQVTNTAGLEVRGSMNANAAVTRTIALNQQVYLKIVDPIWAMVLNEANPSLVTTEYVIFGGSVSELAPVPFIESPDTIVTLDHPVDAGELLGYPGFFMNESPTEGQPIIHFEIFTDTDIAALQRGAQLGGESRILRVQGATNLRKGKLRYNSLNDVPQFNTVGEALNPCEIKISVSEKTKVHVIGDPQINSDFIEVQVHEITKVVPLALLTGTRPRRTCRIESPNLPSVSNIFDGFPLNVNSMLAFRWYCDNRGARVSDPLNDTDDEPARALLTFTVPNNLRRSYWILKSAFNDLRIKEHIITANCSAYLADP
jgi:hypothetical protein